MRSITIAILILAGSALAQPVLAQWKPQKNVEIVAMSGPGGANDVIARAVQRYLQQMKLVQVPVTVTNRPGAGGVLAWNYLNQHAGDGAYLSISPINLLTEHIAGASPITYTDITPIAQLFTEYVAFTVKFDAGYRSGRDLVQRLKPDPGAASFAVAAALGGANHIATALTMKAAGIDIRRLKFVVFTSGPQSLTAAMGGHVDVAVTPISGVVSYVQSGQIRALAVSSPTRQGGAMASVPTWKEQGVDAVFSSFRGVMGPRGLTREQVAYWEDALRRIVQSEEWKRELDRNYWADAFLGAEETARDLKLQYEQYRPVMGELGLAKQ